MTWARHDRGAADALGLVLIAPVMIGLAILVVSLGRGVDSQAQARSAAEAAAQAAALERNPDAARRAALRVVEEMLTDGDACRDPQPNVDLSRFRPGGEVSVTINCHASSRGVELVQPDDRIHSARAVARIDRYRVSEERP